MTASFNPRSTSQAAYLQRRVNRRLNHVPGDRGLPLLGHLLPINRDVYSFLNERIERYGQLSRMDLGPVHGVLVTHPDHLQQVFLDRDQSFSSTMGYEGNVSFMYPGSIILQDFAEHKATRRVFQNAFKRDALAGYVETMSPTVVDNIADWDRQPDFRYVAAVRRILIDVGARVFFGLQPSAESISEIAGYFHEINHVGLMALTHWNIPGTKYWRGQRGKRNMEALLARIVHERRANPGNDLTSILAAECDEAGNPWPVDLLLPHLNVLLFAAHDTTAGATSHLMMYLARPENQSLQEQLRASAFELGKEHPDLVDLDAFVAMDKAVHEALRLHPAVATIMRRTTRAVSLGDCDIPADTMLFNMSHWAHRSPQFWQHPDQFDPERFSAERAEHKQHAFQFLPFGGGAHKCIGMHFAIMNAKLILFHTLRRYRFEFDGRYKGGTTVLPLPFPDQELPLKVTRL